MPLPLQIATMCFLHKSERTLFLDYTITKDHLIHAGKFSPPGGKLEDIDKTIEEGVRREVLEETNIKTRDLIYRGKVTFLNEKRNINGDPMKKNWEVYIYDCYEFDDSQAKALESGKLSWVENSKVLKLPLHEGDYVIWEKWLAKYKEFNGEIEHIGEKLERYTLLSYTLFNKS